MKSHTESYVNSDWPHVGISTRDLSKHYHIRFEINKKFANSQLTTYLLQLKELPQICAKLTTFGTSDN